MKQAITGTTAISRAGSGTTLAMKLLMAAAILLTASLNYANAAVDMEFYVNSNLSEESEATTNYNTHTSLTVDRSGESGAANFFVVAHIAVQVDDITAQPQVRLVYDGGTNTVGEIKGEDGGAPGTGIVFGHTKALKTGHGFTFNFARRVTLSNASHTFEVQFARLGGSGNVYAGNSSIAVFEETTNARYTEQLAKTTSTIRIIISSIIPP